MTSSKQDDQETLEELGQRYELLHQLREEPWGEVWLAEDRLLHTEIALKILPRTNPEWDAGQKILSREAALSLSLRHPFILGVFFLGAVEDGLYLVVEPFAGESLLSRLAKKQRFSTPDTLRLLERVSQAVAFAHQRRVVHQSLNPLHILLAGDEVRVANFACPPGDDDQALHLELKAFTPPEVLRGEEASPESNVFSLGVLGYRLLAGSLPYPLTFDEPFPYRLEDLPVDLDEIPLPLQNLLLQCLAPEPEDRLADAGEFLTQLQKLRELPPGETRETWLDTGGFHTTWRQFSAGAGGILGKVWGAGKSWGQKAYVSLAAIGTRLVPGGRRLWWGLGAAGMLLVLIVLGIQLQRPAVPLPEPAPAAGPTASPSLTSGPPMVETQESSTAAAPPSTAQQPGAGPAPIMAGPAASPAPAREKAAVKGERYLVIAATSPQLKVAKDLAQRLKTKKYQAQVTKMTIKGKTMYLVRLGPFNDKKAAEETAKRLKTKEHLNPRLAQLKPKPAQTPASGGASR